MRKGHKREVKTQELLRNPGDEGEIATKCSGEPWNRKWTFMEKLVKLKHGLYFIN